MRPEEPIQECLEPPIRIVHVLPGLESGGVEQHVLSLACAQASGGNEVMVVSAGGGLVRNLERVGIRHVIIDVRSKLPWSILSALPRLRRELAHMKADVLHAHSRVPALVSWMAVRTLGAGAPVFITTIHGLHSRHVFSRVMTSGDRVIAVSEAAAEHAALGSGSSLGSRMRVVHPGIDPVRFERGFRPTQAWTEAFLAQVPALRSARALTMAGRLSPSKGHQDFLLVLAALVGKGRRVHGLVVGGVDPGKDDYRSALMESVVRLGLDGHVTFLGNRSDLREILASSAVVVAPSRKPESFGLVTLEALALGTPVAAYGHGGALEQFRALLPTGLVPPFDIECLAAKVESFLDVPPAIAHPVPFTAAACASGVMRVYRELLAAPAKFRGAGMV